MHTIDNAAIDAALKVLVQAIADNEHFGRDNVAAAIHAYEDALWRPIETATPDKFSVLVTDGIITLEAWLSHEGVWHYAGGNAIRETPTHWRPLPNPPAE